jgi:hypothetical protein
MNLMKRCGKRYDDLGNGNGSGDERRGFKKWCWRKSYCKEVDGRTLHREDQTRTALQERRSLERLVKRSGNRRNAKYTWPETRCWREDVAIERPNMSMTIEGNARYAETKYYPYTILRRHRLKEKAIRKTEGILSRGELSIWKRRNALSCHTCRR